MYTSKPVHEFSNILKIDKGRSTQMQEENSQFFNKFMFGKEEPRHSGDDWILGRNRQEEKTAQYEKKENKVEQIINNLDYDELMTHVSDLMDSTEQLKPLLKQAGPVIKNFFNQKS